jgi:hypothetical protein
MRSLPRALPSAASFPQLRARGAALVDKTGAIADLLAGTMHGLSRVCFVRPHRFGKTLTLSTAAAMLAAGALPAGVAPWPGHAPVDVGALFGGLQVHERLLRGDATLRGLLQRPHFVVQLGLGGAASCANLERHIIRSLAAVAGQAFGKGLKAEVLSSETPFDALGALVHAVPSAVPVALLVDDCDTAIMQEVSAGRWKAASEGLSALRSLAMATKCPNMGSRIQSCIFAGLARFPLSEFLTGANNFANLTHDPQLSGVLGFSEAEIRASFPAQLARLAEAQGTDVSGAVRELARWHGGFSFDGTAPCFSPLPVLQALERGCAPGAAAGAPASEGQQGASSSSPWLGVSPAALLGALRTMGLSCSHACRDTAELDAKRLRPAQLLLHFGLLTLHLLPATTSAADALECHDPPAALVPPNESARSLLRAAAAGMMGMQQDKAEGLGASGAAAAGPAQPLPRQLPAPPARGPAVHSDDASPGH